MMQTKTSILNEYIMIEIKYFFGPLAMLCTIRSVHANFTVEVFPDVCAATS